MAIDNIFNDGNIDGVADNIFGAVNNSVSEVKLMQQRKAAENVQLVIQALKKIESDIKDRFDNVGNAIEKRVLTIKDGRNGIDGTDGRDGKDGKPGRDGQAGPKGRDGLNGRDGIDGQDGISVVNAHLDFDGSLVITLSNGTEIDVGEVMPMDLAEKIKIVSNGGGTSQYVVDTLASLQTQISALIPSQTGNSGKYLTTDGTNTSWGTVSGGGGSMVYPGAGIPLSTGSAWGTSYPTTGATSVVLRDSSQNVSANSFLSTFTNVAAAGTTTTLTVSSSTRYTVTGSGGQTYQLPSGTTLANGAVFSFNNNQSSGAITVTNNSSTTIATVQAGGFVEITLLSNATTAGSWDVHVQAPSSVSWSTNTFDYAGSITSATWNGVAVAANRGGTGVANNSASTITISGNFGTTFTVTGTTAVTLPTSGTLVNTAVTTLSSLTSIGTIATGVWNGTIITGTYGGTGVNNGSKTITLGGNLTTSGAFNTTVTTTATTAVTLPTSGTLMSSVTALSGAVTGTPSSSTYLRGDGTWATVSVSGGSSISNGTSNVTVNSSGGTVTIATAGTTALTVDTSQRVGIGTTSPSYPLEVSANGYALRISATTGTSRIASFLSNTSGQMTYGLESSTGGALFTGAGAYEGCIGTDVSKNFNLGTGGIVRATIDTSGNLGIGTTAPSNLLTLNTAGNDTMPALGANGGKLGIFSGSLGYGLVVGVPSSGTATLQSQYINGTASALDMALQPLGGNLLVGTSTAKGKLTVNSDTGGGTTGGITLQGVNYDYQGIGLFCALNSPNANSRNWQIAANFISAGRLDFLISTTTTGNPTTSRGYIDSTTGAYVATSDLRLKKNIVDSNYGLSSVLALRPVMYNMIEEEDTRKKHIGLIAQEVKSVVDEAVDDLTDPTKQTYGLDKSGLVPVLIKAIQELNTTITSLTERITALEAK